MTAQNRLDRVALDREMVPRLGDHFRFQWEQAQDCYVLLYPEGMVRLNGSAGEILACCDGKRSLAEIITILQAKYPQAKDIDLDVIEFMGVASEQQWVRIA